MDLDLDLDNLTTEQKLQFGSFGIGGFLLLVSSMAYVHVSAELRPIAASVFIAGFIIMFLPYGIFVYFKDRKYKEMEKEFPAFLRNLSEGIKSGMSLPEAFRRASKTDYGRLNKEVERASHQISWGVPFPEVMERFADRMSGSDLIQRSAYIVLQSYESGGNISETVDAIASNAAMIKEAERKKHSVLIQQVYIIYAIHFLFLFIIIGMYYLLNDFLLNIGGVDGGDMASAGFEFGEVQNFCAPGSIAEPICTVCSLFGLGSPDESICYYQALFLVMLVVEGILNGLVVGEVMEGKASSGIKHSAIMGFLGLVLYVIILNVI